MTIAGSLGGDRGSGTGYHPIRCVHHAFDLFDGEQGVDYNFTEWRELSDRCVHRTGDQYARRRVTRFRSAIRAAAGSDCSCRPPDSLTGNAPA